MLSGYEIIRYGLPACSRETRCLISSVTVGPAPARAAGKGRDAGGSSLCLSCEFYTGAPGEIGMPSLDTAPRRCDSRSGTSRACASAHARTVNREVNRKRARAATNPRRNVQRDPAIDFHGARARMHCFSG